MTKKTFQVALAIAAMVAAVAFADFGANADPSEALADGEIVSPDIPSEKSGWGLSLFGAKQPSAPAVLAAGQRLSVRTTSTLSTKSARSGETFVAYLQAPLVDGQRTVAPTGAQVVGRVTTSDEGGRVKGTARIAVELVEFEAANGDRVKIETGAYVVNAKKTHTKDAQKVGVGAGLGAAIGAIAGGGKGALKGVGVGAGAGTGAVLATRGDAASIPAESVLTFELDEAVSVEL